MSQADYSVDNASGSVVRADINGQLDAIVTNNSGSSAPSTTFANMWWYDTGNAILKVRNAANSAWVNPLVGQQTIWIPAGAMTSRTTDGAASGSFETSTNKVMSQSFDFASSGQDEHIQFAIQMPKGWDEGTLIFQIVWSHPSTTTNFGVVFFMQAVSFANSDALDTAFGTAVSVEDTGGTTDDVFISPESTAITVAGSPGAEEYVIFQVYRDFSDAADNLAVDARLHGVKIHYVTENNVDD